jgi:hypothetical protein
MHAMIARHAAAAACFLAFFVCGHAAQGQESGDKEKAVEHFKKATVLYDEGNYEAALVEFKTSYKVLPNWKLLYYIGLTKQALHDYVGAEKDFTAYLEEGKDKVPEEKKAGVEETLKNLAGFIGSLLIQVDVDGADVFVNDALVGKSPLEGPVRLNLGDYRISVTKEGFEDFVEDIELPGGETLEVDVKMTPAAAAPSDKPEQEKPKPTRADKSKKPMKPAVFYAVVGLTGALLAATAVTGGLAVDTHSTFDDTPEQDWEKRLDLRDRGRKLNTATDVLIGLTSASAAAVLVLAFFTDFKKKEKRAAGLILAPGPGGVQLGIAGSF